MILHIEPKKYFFKEANSSDTSKFVNIRSPRFSWCQLIVDKTDIVQVVHEVVQTLHTGSKWEVRREFRIANLKPISFHLVCIVWCIPWSQILQQTEWHSCTYCWDVSSGMNDDWKGWTLPTTKAILPCCTGFNYLTLATVLYRHQWNQSFEVIKHIFGSFQATYVKCRSPILSNVKSHDGYAGCVQKICK